ncbi:MAG TPA: FkbM family methyltransferase [Magnetospirillaceae bacterium]|nr:FkbM family methyltransferase [Magnetospirillaceae bacterium]
MPDPTIPPPLTSYAQNFEDVLLWRALKEVEAGFYIDIGAQDPVTDSVSRAFYERGWRGLHVEPNSHYAGLLREARPDEEVVQAVISAQPGLADFYEIEGTGLSTADAAIAERHRRDGFPAKKVSVPAMKLAELLDRFKDREIHWLKIDVEGFEGQVIESWGKSTVRPWVLVVESTRPRTQEASADWEPLLLKRGYKPVYFDGLNRFYVAKAHADLAERFTSGPNTFDDFVLAESNYFARPLANELRALRHAFSEKSDYCAALEQGRAEDKIYIGHLEVALERTKRDLSEGRQVERLQQEAIDRERADFIRYQTELQAYVAAIENSRIWRWTRPLRRLANLLKGRAS